MFNNELKVQVLRGLTQSLLAIIFTVLGGLSFYNGVTDEVTAMTIIFIVVGITFTVFGFVLAWSNPNRGLLGKVNTSLWSKSEVQEK